MIRPNMATMLGFVATDAAIAPALLQRAGAARRPTARSTASRSTATPRPTTRSCWSPRSAPATRAIDALDSADGRALARRGDRRRAAARAGDRARRRGRDQVHHRRRSTAARDEAECRAVGLRDRPLAAGQDRVLRQRPEPRAHPRRGRLCRHRRPRPGADRPVPRRRASSSRAAAAVRLPRGGRPARDEAEPRSRCASTCTAASRRPRSGPATCRYDYVKINADYRS